MAQDKNEHSEKYNLIVAQAESEDDDTIKSNNVVPDDSIDPTQDVRRYWVVLVSANVFWRKENIAKRSVRHYQHIADDDWVVHGVWAIPESAYPIQNVELDLGSFDLSDLYELTRAWVSLKDPYRYPSLELIRDVWNKHGCIQDTCPYDYLRLGHSVHSQLNLPTKITEAFNNVPRHLKKVITLYKQRWRFVRADAFYKELSTLLQARPKLEAIFLGDNYFLYQVHVLVEYEMQSEEYEYKDVDSLGHQWNMGGYRISHWICLP